MTTIIVAVTAISWAEGQYFQNKTETNSSYPFKDNLKVTDAILRSGAERNESG